MFALLTAPPPELPLTESHYVCCVNLKGNSQGVRRNDRMKEVKFWFFDSRTIVPWLGLLNLLLKLKLRDMQCWGLEKQTVPRANSNDSKPLSTTLQNACQWIYLHRPNICLYVYTSVQGCACVRECPLPCSPTPQNMLLPNLQHLPIYRVGRRSSVTSVAEVGLHQVAPSGPCFGPVFLVLWLEEWKISLHRAQIPKVFVFLTLPLRISPSSSCFPCPGLPGLLFGIFKALLEQPDVQRLGVRVPRQTP